MNKLPLGLGAALLGLATVGDASAHGPPPLPPRPGFVRAGHLPPPPVAVASRAYHLDHGTRFSGGYYYRGQDHHHWGYRVWNARANCYHYWDPTLRCYYYWSPAQAAYYPVGYALN